MVDATGKQDHGQTTPACAEGSPGGARGRRPSGQDPALALESTFPTLATGRGGLVEVVTISMAIS
jgi:hypothetical protein